MLHLVKENWEMIGISLKLDNNIIRLMKHVKAKSDKARANKRMSAADKWQVVTELKESTMNLAAADWRLKVNKDYPLNAAWRQEKVAFLEDYIGREATRSNLYQLLEKCTFFFFRTRFRLQHQLCKACKLVKPGEQQAGSRCVGSRCKGSRCGGNKMSLLQRGRRRTPQRRISTLMEKTIILLMNQPHTNDHAMKKQVVVVEEEKMQVFFT